MSYTLGSVMDTAAVLLNDPSKTDYTYVKQLPLARMALQELEEEFEQNNVQTTNVESAVISAVAGATTITLPTGLVEIQQMWERLSGTSDPFIPVTKVEFLPHYLEGVQTNDIIWWAFEQDAVKFLPPLTNRDVKLDYIRSLFLATADENTVISVINSKSFLQYRTAALCAEFLGENPTRAQELNQYAVLAMDRALGIPTKGRQAIQTRRRPFRAAYRARTIW